ncbi:MAG: hypothetical protein JXB32_01505 [Deltaproteobacteria bacterium]|nr:hypothetical protein [Deltaproteobacteria bacterium]
MSQPKLTLAVMVLVAAAAPATALGNIAAVQRQPGVLGAPQWGTATPLVVEQEELTFDCADARPEPTCVFEARYRIANPTPDPQSVLADFLGVDTRDVEVRVDGVLASVELSEDERTRFVALLAGLRTGADPHEVLGREATHAGFTLEVEPGGRCEVTATGTIAARARFEPAGWFPAVVTRHLLLDVEVGGRRESEFDLRYLLAPLETWAEARTVTVVVRYPTDWGFAAVLGDSYDLLGGLPAEPPEGWTVVAEGDRSTATWSSDGATPALLDLGFDAGSVEAFHSGGVVLGFGGMVGDGAGGFWMRWGYEVAYPAWLLYGLSVDTDYRDRAILALQLQGASPIASMPVIPSFDVGIGLPIQLLPETQVGVRLMCGFTWGPVGFNATFDLFPGYDTSHPDFAQIGLYGLLVL